MCKAFTIFHSSPVNCQYYASLSTNKKKKNRRKAVWIKLWTDVFIRACNVHNLSSTTSLHCNSKVDQMCNR